MSAMTTTDGDERQVTEIPGGLRPGKVFEMLSWGGLGGGEAPPGISVTRRSSFVVVVVVVIRRR